MVGRMEDIYMPKCSITIANKDKDPIYCRLLELAKKRGIIVYLIDFSPQCRGVWMNNKYGQAIALNDKLTGVRRNFVFAHELGHSALHKGRGALALGYNIDDKQKVSETEREANRFARKLLMIICKNRSFSVGGGKSQRW